MNGFNYCDENIARYFEGELDEKKILEMENLLINDNNKKNEMKDFSKIWEKSGNLGEFDKINMEEDWQKVRSRMGFLPKTKRIPLNSYFIRIAAILLLAFGLVYFFTQLIRNVPVQQDSEYYTYTSGDQSRDIVLPDNSVIVLNKKSKLIYNNNFGTNNRDIILEGEAFFDVERNENLAFRVFADNSTIEVLGTSFNIKLINDKVKVSVISGEVTFYETDKKNNRIGLVKNESSEYDLKTKKFSTKIEISPNLLAWKKGSFVCVQGQPIEELLNAAAAYFDLELKNEMKDGFGEYFSQGYDVNLPANSIDQVMKDIEDIISKPFYYSVENGTLIIRD